MISVILPYRNPDLDGVASALGLEAVFPAWTACIDGAIDAETSAVLTALGLRQPTRRMAWESIEGIWLVDTHHLRQLPPDLPVERVFRIWDHHPGGDFFPRAELRNESIGSVATMVWEAYREGCLTPSSAMAVLLQAAILSNTLDLRAPSTSLRDRAAVAQLDQIEPITPVLREVMRRAKNSILNQTTSNAVGYDVKHFNTGFGTAIVAQVEAAGASDLLERADLAAALSDLATRSGASLAVLNLVDLDAGMSAIVSTSPDVLAALAANLGVDVDVSGVIRVQRLLQRKSDILPVLLNQPSTG